MKSFCRQESTICKVLNSYLSSSSLKQMHWFSLDHRGLFNLPNVVRCQILRNLDEGSGLVA